MEGNQSIDAVLAELGVGVEQPVQEETINQDIGIRLSKIGNRYYINCCVIGKVTEDDFPGNPLPAQYTFSKSNLVNVARKVEERLGQPNVDYKRNPTEGFIDNALVYFELLSPTLMQDSWGKIRKMHAEHTKGLG
ncbi:MAG: hypothetical protein IH934_05920 [Nanoarchaeota archaeon]|nr:hypothetical protein [Nanoarchaeota archaeon]